jgi:hypothetical protein
VTVNGIRRFARQAFGGLFLLVGVLLVLYGIVDNIRIAWIEYPEATKRLLWIEHTTRMIGNTAAFVGGLVLGGLGFFTLSE